MHGDGHNVLFVCFDTLRRDFLGAYRDRPRGFGYEVATPNLDRFAERAAVFDTHYAGSLPTVPARREYLTGTQGFLWRGWGPIEPFDTTIPELAASEGIPSQLVTDNYHLFEERATHGYYEDFTGFELIRGHEADAWKVAPRTPDEGLCRQVGADDPADVTSGRSQYARNVARFEDEADFFSPRVFDAARKRLADAAEWDRWFTMVDSFDVHEPFHCPAPYASTYTDLDPDDPDLPKWHSYGWVDDDYWTDRRLEFVRAQYAGKVTMADAWFGRLLDALDDLGLWGETTVIVTSDHGHCLGDHGYVGKNGSTDPLPIYDVLGRLPLIVWHPGAARAGARIDALTSAVDLHATILDALGTAVTDAGPGHSRSLLPVLRGEVGAHRDWALYGYYSRAVNVTDGRYTYHHPTDPDGPLYTYSGVVPGDGGYISADPSGEIESGAFLPYADQPVWRVPDEPRPQNEAPHLYDTGADPGQEHNLAGDGTDAETRMRDLLVEAMRALEAPEEQFTRLGLEKG